MDVRCPECGRPSLVADGSAGKRARCKCGKVFQISEQDPLLASLLAAWAVPQLAPQGCEPAEENRAASWFPTDAPSVKPADSENPLSALGISLVDRPRREGSLLVISPETVLPDRCVKCNAPAAGHRLVVKLKSGHTRANLIHLVLFLIFPILLLSSSQAEVEVGVCRRHLSRLRRTSAIGGCVIVASLGLIVGGLAFWLDYWPVLAAGIVLLLAALIVMSLTGRLLTAARIEPRLVWIKGVCPEYLSSLPERGSA